LQVTHAEFSSGDAGLPKGLVFEFDRRIADSPLAGELTITNLATQQIVSANQVVRDYNLIPGQLLFALRGFPTGTLPDGNYRATLPAGSAVTSSGDTLAADFTYDFFVLAGDANHDRSVDFNDLVKLAQNYNTTGKTFADGDFTGDGNVDFNDLVLLAQRYNTSLPLPGAAAMPSASATSFAADWAAATAPCSRRSPPPRLRKSRSLIRSSP
jgi:hypothetical protein